jgi:hypothetical protein
VRANLLSERLLALPIDDAANSSAIDRARPRRWTRPTCRVCSARGTRGLWLGGDGEIAEKRWQGSAPVEKEGGLYRGATVTDADIDIEARPTAPPGYRESNGSAWCCSGLPLHSLAYRRGRHPSTPTSSLFCAIDSKNEHTRGLITSGRVSGAM